ncbi:MAG: diguanylate cyclase [Thermodesulfobacteriota bacterium]
MKKILVVDNNPVIRKLLSSALEKEDFTVMAAEDGLSAFDLLSGFTPDIIFLDLVMPNINGEQFCRMVAKRNDLADTTIIVISGVAVEAGGECEIQGVQACIAKGPNLVHHVVHAARTFSGKKRPKDAHPVYGADEVFPREISRELLAANRHLRVVLNNMSEGIMELASDNRIIFANPAAALLAGVAMETLLAHDFTTLFSGKDRERVIDILRCGQTEIPVRIDEEKPVFLNNRQVSIHFLPVQDRESRTIIAMIKDISKTKIAENRLKEAKDYLSSIFHAVQAGILVIDAETNRIVDANPKALELFGLRKNEMEGRFYEEFVPFSQDHDGSSALDKRDTFCPARTRTITNGRGEQIHILKTTSDCLINERKFFIKSFLDISEQKKLEEKLHVLSITDELTGLLNRRGFFMMANKQLRIADRNQGRLLLLFADVDNLKVVNDSYGHDVGDALLVKVSAILSSFRSSDIIGRLGGDEFAVLVSDSSDDGGEQKLINRFQALLDEANRSNGFAFDISVSIGVATYDREKTPRVDELIAEADRKMYFSKKDKKTSR